jgi:ferredoxin
VTDLNFGECIGCGLCILGCPAYEETGFDVLTARGRNKALQAGLGAAEMVEPIWACTLCGYCDAICPNDVHNVAIVLHLRRELAEQVVDSAPAARPVVLGCTVRERAPHLIASIDEFLRRIGRSTSTPGEGCCGSLEVEAGRARPARARAGVVADPICLEQYDAEFLGTLAMQHLDLFELTPPFYYFAPHRWNRDHAGVYRLRCAAPALRPGERRPNRLARSTPPVRSGPSGRDAPRCPRRGGALLAIRAPSGHHLLAG